MDLSFLKQIKKYAQRILSQSFSIVLILVFFVAATVQASTTVGTNIQTDGTLSVTGVSSFVGNVGVGTTTPGWNLQVAGTRPSFSLTDFAAATNLKHWLFSSMGGNLYIGTSTDIYGTSTPSALTISNAGNATFAGSVTATTFNFTSPLAASSGGTGKDSSAWNGFAGVSSGVWYQVATSTISLGYASTTQLGATGSAYFATASGNVGVGTTSPWGKVSVGNGELTSPAFAVATGTNKTAFTVDSNGDTRPYGRLLLPMGEINYFNTTGTLVSISTQSNGSTNLVKVAPTTSLNNDMEFDNGGADNGRLRYIGATTRVFHTAFTISMDGEGAGTNLYVFGIAKNGAVGNCKVIQSIAVSNDTQSTALHCMVTLATNDYLELYVGNLTDADDITVKTMNLFAMGM